MAGPSVLAVLVAHASRTRVGESLRSLLQQTYGDLEVAVAAIGDLTVPDEAQANATVVPVEEGAGFAKAVGEVLGRVDLDEYDYVLLAHDDVSLAPDVVERMVATAQTDPQIAAVGAKLVEWYQPEVLQEVGAAIDRYAIRRSSLDAGEVDHGQRDDVSDVLFCSDACLLFRRAALVESGGLDEKAWPFYEDVDLCWRMRAQGHRVVVEPTARVRHAADLSSGRRLFESAALSEHAERGRLRFMFKHYAPIGLILLLPQLLLVSAARLVAAVARRELWRVRVTIGAWTHLLGELPEILRERRRAPKARVEDRELLALAARGAAGDVRGERAESASRMLAVLGRAGDRAVRAVRRPVTWVAAAGVIAVVLVLREVLFGGTFALGEIRPLPAFSDAISDHYSRVRREGLDPFAPAGPGLVVLAALRSLVGSAALAQKLMLLLPVVFAGFAGARLARTLGLADEGPRWVAVFAAVNPVTLSLLRDGAFGAMVMWSASLWMAAHLLAPPEVPSDRTMLVRFLARWSFAWALVVALHPPALVWLLAFGAVFVAARAHDDRNRQRRFVLATGAVGSFLLLLPWSIQWLTPRTPLFGRPGWLVQVTAGGLDRASLGAGWPFLLLLALALGAVVFVGLTKTTFGLSVLAGVGFLAGAAGLFPRESMVTAAGACVFVLVTIAGRRVADDLARHELGSRQAAVVAGIVGLAAVWVGGAVHVVPQGSHARDIPVIAGMRGEDTGRVLWLSETTRGVRSWSTLSFSERTGVFPPSAGPEERLVTRALEGAREGRTHRLGGVLALADISHIVALDSESRRGLAGQADIAPLEEQAGASVYRNDAWQGAAIVLPEPPASPLTPSGLAGVVRDPQPAQISGWPYGPMTLRLDEAEIRDGSVLYVASGRRGGLRVDGNRARVSAAGVHLPVQELQGDLTLSAPGRLWRWMLPLQTGLVLIVFSAWFVAAYIGRPRAAARPPSPDAVPVAASRVMVAVAPVLVVAAAFIGWTGAAWGVGTPFLSSAWYCPPIGEGYEQSLAIANPNEQDVTYQVRPHMQAPVAQTQTIEARGRESVAVDPEQGAVIESYGDHLVVAALVARQGRADSSLCASGTRTHNVFPEGGRGATRAVPRLFERYVLYNPFPDLARASVRFVSPDETISPPALQDVRIPPGSVVVVDPEEQFEPMLDLSTTVRVWQGRALIARRLRTEEQVSWSLPVEEVESGTVPRASTESAVTELVAVNLSEDPARVSVFGAGAMGSLPEEGFEVPAVGRNDFELNSIAPNSPDLVVGVTANRPVALESLVVPDGRATVSLLPMLQPQRRWVLPMVEGRELVLVNPSARSVTLDLIRLGPGPRLEPVTIEANRVARVPVEGEGGFGVLVESRGGGVTAAAVGPTGTIPGAPLR